jgi:hypothetical protein
MTSQGVTRAGNSGLIVVTKEKQTNIATIVGVLPFFVDFWSLLKPKLLHGSS